VLYRIGGLLDLTAGSEQGRPASVQGGLYPAGGFGGAVELKNHAGIGGYALRQGLPVSRLARRRFDAADEAAILQGGHGPKTDHALLELRRLVGSAGLQSLAHRCAAGELAVHPRRLLHVGGEGAGCRRDLGGQLRPGRRRCVVGNRQSDPGDGSESRAGNGRAECT
jgi:hypothetical protein